ncbi:GAF domain-containing protein [Flexithrix dorotheae]|uniref:GAF domain-containing protein n=1 Tax=Flexithrix dorotheae TaxID=70993 RepID=UPI0003665963|nr:GAF domain-containing protein [Flexithrix dorotheae]
MTEIDFKYKTSLSFEPLYNYLKEKINKRNCSTEFLIKSVQDTLEQNPELRGSITDLSVLEKHQTLLNSIMSLLFSPVDLDTEICAIVHPFKYQTLTQSSKWEELITFDEKDLKINAHDFSEYHTKKMLYANSIILKEIYGQEVNVHNEIVYTLVDKETGLNKYYKLFFNKDFAELIYKKEPVPLSEEILKLLSQNIDNIELWDKYIDYGNFEFRGFLVMKLVDVTQNEVLSSLKSDLLQKDTIISKPKFRKLESKLREYFANPNLKLGIISFSGNMKDGEVKSGPKIWNSILDESDINKITCEKGKSIKKEAFEGCIYHLMMEEGKTQVIEDLENYPRKSPIEHLLLEKGIKSILVSPLIYDGKVLGGIEIASTKKEGVDWSSISFLRDILPIFSLAAKRSLEELESKLQALIKEEYTAIHPSVEWRFAQAALNKMDKQTRGEMAESESIVFNNVYPIYGQSDVRGSSLIRNTVIQADLIEQLNLAKKALLEVKKNQNLKIAEEIIFRIDKAINGISEKIGSGDETTVLYFIKNEIEPLIIHFYHSKFLSEEAYNEYFSNLDVELGILYKRRKAFEDSLTKMNDTISHFIEEEEVEAQEVFPHYFEKYKTDGVEYNLYIGSAIVPSRKFDLVYLQNLRLWQMELTSKVAIMAESLKDELPMPLDTTHLILVNNTPISIRFREDEKQFDVDGAYNIRYEIIKKRIDKAHIKGTDERLTQPRKIAIVYAQDKEAQEYRRYIEYLQHKGYLENDVEELDLEELQGVNGLKALRVEVKIPAKNDKDNFPKKVIEKIFKEKEKV